MRAPARRTRRTPCSGIPVRPSRFRAPSARSRAGPRALSIAQPRDGAGRWRARQRQTAYGALSCLPAGGSGECAQRRGREPRNLRRPGGSAGARRTGVKCERCSPPRIHAARRDTCNGGRQGPVRSRGVQGLVQCLTSCEHAPVVGSHTSTVHASPSLQIGRYSHPVPALARVQTPAVHGSPSSGQRASRGMWVAPERDCGPGVGLQLY